MAVVGKLAAGLVSAANENTLALASLKFDFSLLKVDAPQEYSALGNALSTRRRREAEDGPQHRTARRLGALFEQVIPSTPHLIKSYGLRASEIINTRGINPQGSPRDGPFEMFVGADGTALWAAATSGISTLAVYLLACLLARAWEPKVAVAIWVEITAQRRKEIQEGYQNHVHVSESSYLSTLQVIPRRELAQWDASARAWSQSAERAKIVQDTQLMLIIKNVNLPFPGGSSVLSQVISSWRHAMICLDCLLKGEPQVISNQIVLLAFSAWHIYPDLMVLEGSPQLVNFNDALVHRSGVGTLTFQSRSSDGEYANNWSLALSHLRYYGDPVVATSDPNFSRITIDQLHLVALGSLLDQWQVKQRDTSAACQWLIEIWRHLESQDWNPCQATQLKRLGWLRIFANAAAKCEHTDTDEKAKALQLLAFGRRRAKSFLGVSPQVLVPYFGLANPCILRSLCCVEDYHRGLVFLRELAGGHGLKSGEAFIQSHFKWWCSDVLFNVMEIATAVAHTYASKKRDHDGKPIIQTRHARWLYVEYPYSMLLTEGQYAKVESEIRHRMDFIRDSGDLVIRLSETPFEGNTSKWKTPPLLFDFHRSAKYSGTGCDNTDVYCCPSISDNSISCRCFECDTQIPHATSKAAYWQAARIGDYSMFVKTDANYQRASDHYSMSVWVSSVSAISASSDHVTSRVTPTVLADYLAHCSDPDASSDPWLPNGGVKSTQFQARDRTSGIPSRGAGSIYYVFALAHIARNCRRRLLALRALVLATEIYRQLEGATISLKVVGQPIESALWLPESPEQANLHSRIYAAVSQDCLRRTQIFACIFHFETGLSKLEPQVFKETLAIASGNSLFVTSLLLSDPMNLQALHGVQRITGSIGRPGISLLTAPVNPKIRPLSDQFHLVNHSLYDGNREDHFQSTSVHLSFTDWQLPIDARGDRNGTIDQEVHMVESVVSVLESGKWVADLDVFAVDFDRLVRIDPQISCAGHPEQHLPTPAAEEEHSFADADEYTSIDSWEELLDEPNETGIFRAHGNWAARLAAVSVLAQKKQQPRIRVLSGSGKICVECLTADPRFRDPRKFHQDPDAARLIWID